MHQQSFAIRKNSVWYETTKWVEVGKIISKQHKAYIFRALVRVASGLFVLFHLLSLLPPFPLLHSDHAWEDSAKAGPVLREPLTPDS